MLLVEFVIIRLSDGFQCTFVFFIFNKYVTNKNKNQSHSQRLYRAFTTTFQSRRQHGGGVHLPFGMAVLGLWIVIVDYFSELCEYFGDYHLQLVETFRVDLGNTVDDDHGVDAVGHFGLFL